jgi:hypothetical protein
MKQFSLKSMLILVTGFALLLGYSQWRRQCIRAECKILEGQWGFTLPDSWTDYIWQRKPVLMYVPRDKHLNEIEEKYRHLIDIGFYDFYP